MTDTEHPLTGKKALVTGASRGIGASVARILGMLGAELTIVGRSHALEAVAEQIERDTAKRGHPVAVQAVHADLTKASAIEWVVQTVDESVDILVNNAGVGHFGRVQDPGLLSLAEWDEMFNLNVRATFYLTKLLLPAMIERGAGDIVNIASRAGLVGYKQGAGYCASKAAVRLFSDALRHDLRGTGVRVALVSPGTVNTTFFEGKHSPLDPSTKLANYLKPDDVAVEVGRAVTMARHMSVKELLLVAEHQPW